MDTGIISRRYARVLAFYSADKGEEELVYDRLGGLAVRYRQDHAVQDLVLSPVVSPDDKVAAVCALSSAPMPASFADFLRLVFRHRRESCLNIIFHSFRELYRERHHLREAELVTASEVSDDVEKELRSKMQEWSKCTVSIRRKVNPDIIGGFVFRMDDTLIDASVATQLAILRGKLGSDPVRKI